MALKLKGIKSMFPHSRDLGIGFETKKKEEEFIEENLGIGIESPTAKLHVLKGTAGTPTLGDSTVAVFERDEGIGTGSLTTISIIGDHTARILFGDDEAERAGEIRFIHLTDELHFYAQDNFPGLSITQTKIQVNRDQQNYKDFIVKGDTDENLIYVDASTDKVGIGLSSPSAKLDINSDILRLRTAKTPASAGASGNAGDICWDSSYIYVCVAANTWKRAAIASW